VKELSLSLRGAAGDAAIHLAVAPEDGLLRLLLATTIHGFTLARLASSARMV
jgi:hypothetical protein